MNINICKFNQSGYCKFRQMCHKQHENQICQEFNCDRKTCILRHPKLCKYFETNGFCKFKEDCAFTHSRIVKSSETTKQEIEDLKKVVEKLRKDMTSLIEIKVEEKALQISINRLRDDIVKLKLDNKVIEHKVNLLEENDESKIDNCEVEGKVCDDHENTTVQKTTEQYKHTVSEGENISKNDLDFGVHFQMEILGGENWIVCNICNEGFENSDKLEEHIVTDHRDDIAKWEEQFEDTSDLSDDDTS